MQIRGEEEIPLESMSNDYLIADRMMNREGDRTREIDQRIGQGEMGRAMKVAQWLTDPVCPPSYSAVDGNSRAHECIRGMPIQQLMNILLPIRKKEEFVEPVQYRGQMIPVSEIVSILDLPVLSWLEDENINDSVLIGIYGREETNLLTEDKQLMASTVPIPLQPRKSFPIFWMSILCILVVGLSLAAFAIYRCSGGRCTPHFIGGAPYAAEFKNISQEFPFEFGQFSLFLHPMGLELATVRNTSTYKSIHMVLNATLHGVFSWMEPEMKGLHKVAHTVYCTDSEDTCYVKLNQSNSPMVELDGRFQAEASLNKSSPRYRVVKNGEKLIYEWDHNSNLQLIGSLANWEKFHREEHQDSLFSNDDGWILLGNDQHLSICRVKLDRRKKGIPMFEDWSGCQKLPEIRCSSNGCEYSLVRLSYIRYAIAAHPLSGKGKTIIHFYEVREDGSYNQLAAQVETIYHEKPVYTGDFNHLQMCSLQELERVVTCRNYILHKT